ncbi:MAG: protein kinase, partial [Planctomycetes bacterium]|nr:protein kinase [Planctomycetota bacterium]
MSDARPPIETVSHYRLLEPLGHGAMSEVWLAEDTHLPRKVAVKLLARHLANDREAIDRLLREARAAASVDHPAVVTVYEAGLESDVPYLVMQRVEGETLAERLRQGSMPIDEAIAIGATIADALAEVHAIGIVHRDLKPSNVMLTAHGPKILDFGLASVRGAVTLTTAGTAMGTPLWMSPEQMRGRPADNRSDLWALGVMLYQMLTGKPPFAGESLEALFQQVLHENPTPPSTLRPEIVAPVDFAVMKLLRKDAAHRYAHAEDLLADLAPSEPRRGASTSRIDMALPSPRLAVLYFEVMSGDPDDEYLAAGLT